MIINKVVIHELVKEQREDIKPSHIRDTVLDPNNDAVGKLVEGITSLYGRRNNSAHYGTFQTNEARGIFPDPFETYAGLNTPTNNQFLDLTNVAMRALYGKAMDQHLASGGYIIFADYSTDQHRYFLVAMIKQKDGLKLSNNLEPEELTELDLSRLYQAARINFSRLSMFLAANDRDRLDLSYLSFVSPSSGKTAAGYFVTALGCAKGTAPSRATDTLVKEACKFFKKNKDLAKHRIAFKGDLLAYLKQKEQDKVSAKLSEIEELARPYMPAEEQGQADAIADEFISHLNSEECAVPVEFPVSKRSLNKHTHIKYRTDQYEINFERGALGDDDTAQIYYDIEQNRIIISDIPPSAADELKKELKSRRQN